MEQPQLMLDARIRIRRQPPHRILSPVSLPRGARCGCVNLRVALELQFQAERVKSFAQAVHDSLAFLEAARGEVFYPELEPFVRAYLELRAETLFAVDDSAMGKSRDDDPMEIEEVMLGEFSKE